MYVVSRARLFQVGTPGAWFDDVTVDFRDGAAEPEAARVPAWAAVLVGENGVGKTVLLDLVQSVPTPEDPNTGGTEHFRTDRDRLSHVMVEYDNRRGSQIMIGMILASEPDPSSFPSAVRRNWYVFTPSEQLSLDKPPFNAADKSFDEVAARSRKAATNGNDMEWFTSYTGLHAYIHTLGFPVRLYCTPGGSRSLWQRVLRGAPIIERDLLRELISGATVDRLVRHMKDCQEASPETLNDTKDTLLAGIFEAAQEFLGIFRTTTTLPIFSNATKEDLIPGIDTSSITISHPSDSQLASVARTARGRKEAEYLVLGMMERTFDGEIEFTANRHNGFPRDFDLPPGGERALARWSLFLVAALIKSERSAPSEDDVVGTLFVDDHVELQDSTVGLARALKVSRAMGFQVILTSPYLRPTLAAADVMIGINSEYGWPRTVGVTAHTRSGFRGDPPDDNTDPAAGAMEHITLTELFEFVPSEDAGSEESAMHEGDVVLSAFISSTSPVLQENPRVVDDSVLALRPLRELDHRERLFYRRYFDSEAFTAQLIGPDDRAWLRPWNLSCLRIPRPDAATLHALSELTNAAQHFTQWSREAEDAVRSYFKWDNVTSARSHMINAGRLTRQRREAGSLIDARESRLRTTLPYPVATRWRAVQAARHDHGGYAMVLECAEAVLAYSAVLGLVLARAEGLPAGPLRHQANRFARGGSGPTFGTWGTIVDYFASASPFRSLPADSPLANFAQLARPEVSKAIAANKRRRDHNAHRRGPSPHETRSVFEEAKSDLLVLLEAVEWLVDFPLRHIEHSRWDTYEEVSQLSYRELMGDHNVVSLYDDTVGHIIEADSPYAVDQFGQYHLLRPFLVSKSCETCGQLTVFVIDEWDPAAETATYLALDHAHTIVLTNQRRTLEQVGLLPPPTTMP